MHANKCQIHKYSMHTSLTTCSAVQCGTVQCGTVPCTLAQGTRYAGDTTVQLLWRLQHGELPTKTDTKQAVVLIGTNDLTAYHQHQVHFVLHHNCSPICLPPTHGELP